VWFNYHVYIYTYIYKTMFDCNDKDKNTITLLLLVLFIIIIIFLICNTNEKNVPQVCSPKTNIKEKYVDYMPNVQNYKSKCPSSRVDQEKKESILYDKIYMDSKNSDPEQFDTDECRVLAKDAESTKSQIMRANMAYDGIMPEGTYTPNDEIEVGMMKTIIR
jgi:hypothetical protein